MTPSLHIDRLDLDLRGIAPETAEAAVRLLGPALAQALSQSQRGADAPRDAASGPLDAGRIHSPRQPDAQALATQIADHLAPRLTDRLADRLGGGPR